MRARNIMTTGVFTVSPQTTVREIARLLLEKGISGVPVVDHGRVIGIVSEADLIHRQELGTEKKKRSLGLQNIGAKEPADADDAKSHGRCARDVMTGDVFMVSEDTSLPEIADRLETKQVRRVLVMHGTKLVGIISRANLMRALAARPEGSYTPESGDDDEIRAKVIETLESISGTSPWLTTAIVTNRVVDLYGTVEDEAARDPSRIAIENIPFVAKVRDHRGILNPY